MRAWCSGNTSSFQVEVGGSYPPARSISLPTSSVDRARPCEGRRTGSTPVWATEVEAEVAEAPGCEPGGSGFDSHLRFFVARSSTGVDTRLSTERSGIVPLSGYHFAP